MKQTLILDCDGVLLDWTRSFTEWVYETYGWKPNDSYPKLYNADAWYDIAVERGQELVTEFNASEAFASIYAIDSVREGLELVKAAGMRTHVITCAGPSKTCHRRRRENLNNHFPKMIDKLTCIPMTMTKTRHLSQYDGSDFFFIEDHHKHAASAIEFNIQPILVRTNQNYGQRNPHGIKKVNTFLEACKHVLANS